jgi:hypothetical protein
MATRALSALALDAVRGVRGAWRTRLLQWAPDGWVDELPGLVASLADEWEFAPARPLGGGTEISAFYRRWTATEAP